jgi:hypothetical protein
MTAAMIGRLKRFIHVIPRQLASVKVGLMLVILIFAFMLVAAFFPADEAVGFIRHLGKVLALEDLSRVNALSFQERFESPPFILLVVVLSLSLCFSLYFRIKSELKRLRAKEPALAPIEGSQQRSGPAGAAVTVVEQELQRHGYHTHAVCVAGNWKVHGNKGGSGVWGSVLFHVGLLLVLAAVVLSTSASFKASVKLIEGQAFDARVDRYGTQSAGRWYMPAAQPLTFRLARVDPDYEIKGASTVASLVEPTLEGKRSRFSPPVPVHISHGLQHAGVTIHQGKETGFAPLVMIEDPAGKRVFEGYTRLATLAGSEKETYQDYVDIAAAEVRAEFELFPDAAYRDGAYLSKSAAPKNPVLHVVLRERGKIVLDQFIRLTATASGGGYAVFFGGLRRWSQLDITDTPGVPVLLAATLLGSLGLALRLLRVRRRILVALPKTDQGGGSTVVFDISGSSEKFQRTFDEELGLIRVALAQRLATLAQPAGARTSGNSILNKEH